MDITIVGGGLAGLTAAVAGAEHGANVTLYESHETLGGRARSSGPPYIANEGPHVLYDHAHRQRGQQSSAEQSPQQT